ncbi:MULTISPECIES: tRNA (guanine-N1)-methyltransferase [Aestuariibaculum]|uniref:tRNA (Guanine-N1)-methyltransferase n=1 Tax=Aestuariibaculum lutulentum TaxID=2920935 RepID=A0ABS9RLM9_9FLAO|nr:MULTISPECIES: tRNA (guanine-N1)-methyltransferase [Aestuariibaculum]MCH4553024.1 tRNA (guanine-N1)-methyltransferase [Aestuariibaculum lutulentum]MCR8669082.1 tRNA (guanine-N1)-methyltransferase [Aestuariibaculum sp. M13]
MNKIKYLAVFSFLFTATLFAQTENDEDKLSLNSGTIDNQFEYAIQRSNNYQDYKVIKKTWLYTLKAHTLDSLNAIQKNLNDTKAVVNTQAKEIDNLKASLSETQNTLNETNLEKDSMSLFGIQMSKGSYNVLMWSIIGGLLVLLVVFIYKFKNSNIITTEARKALSEIEEEFEEHRKVALEREQKVRRQLQDEINKHKKI